MVNIMVVAKNVNDDSINKRTNGLYHLFLGLVDLESIYQFSKMLKYKLIT